MRRAILTTIAGLFTAALVLALMPGSALAYGGIESTRNNGASISNGVEVVARVSAR